MFVLLCYCSTCGLFAFISVFLVALGVVSGGCGWLLWLMRIGCYYVDFCLTDVVCFAVLMWFWFDFGWVWFACWICYCLVRFDCLWFAFLRLFVICLVGWCDLCFRIACYKVFWLFCLGVGFCDFAYGYFTRLVCVLVDRLSL